jgi:hypothetical protein
LSKEENRVAWLVGSLIQVTYLNEKTDEWRVFNQVTHTKWICMKKAEVHGVALLLGDPLKVEVSGRRNKVW